MQSVNILIQALQQYEGTFITVSHDRHFIRGTANKIWYIENHQIKEYPGTYDEYVFWKEQQIENQSQQGSVAKAKEENKKKVYSDSEINQAKKELKKKEQELSQIEEKIVFLEEKKSALEAAMADPEIFSDSSKLDNLNKDYQILKAQEEDLNAKWEILVEEIGELQENAG
jgi:ATP-binding cassette subfamily F protein 3